MTNQHAETARPVEPDNAHQTTPPAVAITITAADMEATHYGIPVCHVGDDGEGLIALGHHPMRRALAAFNAHHRRFVGLSCLFDDRRLRVVDVVGDIASHWVVFRKPDPDGHPGDDPEYAWYLDAVSEDTPGAVPVMWLDGR